jgi:hypothetical protein
MPILGSLSSEGKRRNCALAGCRIKAQGKILKPLRGLRQSLPGYAAGWRFREKALGQAFLLGAAKGRTSPFAKTAPFLNLARKRSYHKPGRAYAPSIKIFSRTL